jgi:cell division control protein 6
MPGPFSDVTETIFAEKDVLSESYQPEEILERDEEITEYRYALEDVLFGREPENIMLYGKAGLGKTAVTTYMMEALCDEVQQRDEADELSVHEVNCNGKTLFMVVRHLVNELLPVEASAFPKRGLGTGDAFEELYQELDRLGGTHIVVFDEIDHLDDADTLLYELPRARSNGHLTDAYVSVIGISNNYTFRKSLSPKVKDSLMETEISFGSYNASELRTILYDRADRAFVEDGYEKSAIEMAAAIAASDMGNARQAIDLLRIGAELAKREDDDCVTDVHITDARTRAQRGRLSNRIRDQPQHAQLILETIARLDQHDRTPVRSKTIQKHYETVAEAAAVDPLTSLKSIQDHLSDLNMLGFLYKYERNKGLSGGQYYEHELDLDPEIVLETRKEIKAEGKM